MSTKRELLLEQCELGIVQSLLPAEAMSPPDHGAQQLTQPLANDCANCPQDPTIVTGACADSAQSLRPPAAVGEQLQGRFDLVALIGEGGMSRVFKAIDLRRVEAGIADPYIAVKILTAPLNEYFGSMAAVQREAHKLQQLSHPNIVRVNDCDRDGQTVFMTMEYLTGESLQTKLRRGKACGIAASQAQSIVVAVANALEYAHRNHIVHGDLKPGNVIITDDGVVKVIDFGMARIIARPGEARDGEPAKGGVEPKAITAHYASPEMLAGNDPQPADDIYGLACLAYEILSGRHPFPQGDKIRARDPHWRPPRPPTMRKPQYSALIHALQFDRRARTPTVRQFLQEFTRRGAPRGPQVYAWSALAILVLILGAVDRLHTRHFASPAPVLVNTPAKSFRDCPNCPLLTVVPAGRFLEGSALGDKDSSAYERPQHPVVIRKPFAIGTRETTVGEFGAFVTATGRAMYGCNIYDGRWRYRADANWQDPGFAQNGNYPVTCVSWNDARAYAAWLSQTSGHIYRLPSAAEWEYAARGGGTAAQPWKSSAAACADANVADQSAARHFPGWDVFPCDDGHVNTAPVASFKANAFGLYDMLGNVFAWVADCWHDDYTGAPADGSAREDKDCTEHELRGGSWYSPPRYVRAPYRNRFAADYRSSSVGFRLVREIRSP